MDRRIESQNSDIAIQWVKRHDKKYLVKFNSINIPIEMNERYYNSVLNFYQEKND